MHGARGRDPPAARCVSRPLATYTWDSEDRLIRVDLPGTVASYVYDPLGRRIQKTVNGELTRYLYDGEDIVAELDAANTVMTSFVHGPGIDEPLALVRDGRTYTYHRDGLGSITHLTDDAGLVVQRYAYDAYGNVAAELDPDFIQPYGFTGRERDRETGLLYYRARYYDPRAGRFLGQDPLGQANGPNLYTYARGNPINLRDPTGLASIVLGVSATAQASTGQASGPGAAIGVSGSAGIYVGFPTGLRGDSTASGAFVSTGTPDPDYGGVFVSVSRPFVGVVGDQSGPTHDVNVGVGPVSVTVSFDPSTGKLTGVVVGLGPSLPLGFGVTNSNTKAVSWQQAAAWLAARRRGSCP